MLQGSKRVSSHLKRFQTALRKLVDPDAVPETSFDEFLEDRAELQQAIESGKMRLSKADGSIFFHMTPTGFIARERSVTAEFKELWTGRKPGASDFNHALADDHPHNVAWAERAYKEQEKAIAKLKANPNMTAPQTITLQSNARIAVPKLAL